jgi:hypothetical protein
MMGELERSETLPPGFRASNFEPSELYETKLREGAQVANAGQRFQRVAAGRPTARPGIWFLAGTRFSAALAETESPGLASPSGCTTERRGGELDRKGHGL